MLPAFSMQGMIQFARFGLKIRNLPQLKSTTSVRQFTKSLGAKMYAQRSLGESFLACKNKNKQFSVQKLRPLLVQQRRSLNIASIKRVDAAIRPEYGHLSPVTGVSYIETGFLKRLYQFGNPQHKTVQLVRALFHLLDNNQFRTTQNKSLPGFSLNAELIGDIIAYLEQGRLEDKAVQEQLIQKWCPCDKPLIGKKRKNNQKKREKKVRKLIDLIIASAHECKMSNLYVNNFTQQILLALLHRKAESKDELCSYLNAVNNHLPVLVQEIDKQSFIESRYTKQEAIKNIKRYKTVGLFKKREKARSIIENDYERTVHAAVCDQRYNKPYPPMVNQSKFGYRNKEAVKDCFEASMRDMFNILVTNPKKQQFDINMLPTTVKPAEDFSQFYKTYSSFDVNDYAVGQAWMNLVSGHDFLAYDSDNDGGDYELYTTVENFIGLANYCFGTNAKTTKELGKLLSDERRTVTFKQTVTVKRVNGNDEAKTTIILTIEQGNDYPILHGTLRLGGQDHANFSLRERDQEAFKSKSPIHPTIARHLLNKIEKGGSTKSDVVPAASLLLFATDDQLNKYSKTPASIVHTAYACKFEDPYKLEQVIIDSLGKIKKHPELADTVKHWITKLPELEQNKGRIRVAQAIAEHHLNRDDQDFADFVDSYLSEDEINDTQRFSITKMITIVGNAMWGMLSFVGAIFSY